MTEAETQALLPGVQVCTVFSTLNRFVDLIKPHIRGDGYQPRLPRGYHRKAMETCLFSRWFWGNLEPVKSVHSFRHETHGGLQTSAG
jgi:hypothetical protein